MDVAFAGHAADQAAVSDEDAPREYINEKDTPRVVKDFPHPFDKAFDDEVIERAKRVKQAKEQASKR